jgi:hypothetical protein
MPKTIALSDIRKEAQKLIDSGRMPQLPQLLGAVAFARNLYAGRIKAAQASGPEPDEHGAPVDFGGRVFPNPTGIKPELDTEHRTTPRPLAPGTAVGNIDNAPLTLPAGSTENAPLTDHKVFPAPEEVER